MCTLNDGQKTVANTSPNKDLNTSSNVSLENNSKMDQDKKNDPSKNQRNRMFAVNTKSKNVIQIFIGRINSKSILNLENYLIEKCNYKLSTKQIQRMPIAEKVDYG